MRQTTRTGVSQIRQWKSQWTDSHPTGAPDAKLKCLSSSSVKDDSESLVCLAFSSENTVSSSHSGQQYFGRFTMNSSLESLSSLRPGIRFSGGCRTTFIMSTITSVLSERPFKLADQKTERGKILNPEYSICRDQPTSRASPLRINTLLSNESPKDSQWRHLPRVWSERIICVYKYISIEKQENRLTVVERRVGPISFLGH